MTRPEGPPAPSATGASPTAGGRRLPSVREMLDTLIGLPSVSSSRPELDRPNRPVVDALATWAEGLGFAVEVLELPGSGGRKANLLATLGQGPGGLVLAGHTDTVPFDEGLWQVDPFVATERDGRLYGLGATDMKSFLALALEAARAFRAQDLREPVIILGTADEETTMAGARLLQEAGRPRARRAVVGEPTDLRPVRAHKGILMESIRVSGRSGHSSNPALGANALEGMHAVIAGLLSLRKELTAAHRDDTFEVPHPTLNLGRIEGGDAANRICGRCVLDVDVRLVPGLSVQEARRRVQERAEEALAGHGDPGLTVDFASVFEGVDAFSAAPDLPLLRAVERLTGHAADRVGFGTEAPFFAGLGMDTVICGPGSIDVAHQPDEYLPLGSVEPTIRMLRGLIQESCVDGGSEA